ncbi:MAG: hypothetical protein H7A23_03940 [Leptospiraceae bacterium]|nr:hypothetical protein [Leptospiraceae bacterium]MCP5493683.1 hypothetical protein [Leptospiraceae bacterium]
MAYGTYKTIEEVGKKFDIESEFVEFLKEEKVQIEVLFFQFFLKNLKTPRNYISENSICETIISPILNIITEKHLLPVWSHVHFDVSEEEGLTGIPDFLIAPTSKTGFTYTNPIVCIAEVKKENFEEGWTQVLCEMIAAQRFNNKPNETIYGIATSGSMWQFGKLIGKKFIMDPRIYSATVDLQRLLDALNWFICEAKKEL